jgi:dihydroorotase
MSLLIKNARILIGKKFCTKNVFCEKGKISEITNSNKKIKAKKVINAKGKFLLPGGIDVHVHFREPGMEKKGNWKTESKAAVFGGITTVIDMPNTIPPTTTLKALKEKKRIAEKNSLVNFAFHFGAEKKNLNEIKKLNEANEVNSIKVYMGSSTGSLLTEEESLLKKIFEIAKEKNLVVVVHAENEKTIQKNLSKAKEKNWNKVKFHNKIRSVEAEVKAVKEALKLQKKTGNKIHFAHISTEESLKEILKAKKSSNKISVEVCPHHLFLNESHLKKLGNFGKVNPPLRTKKDNEFLMKKLIEGKIDVVSSDHAPHTKKEKLNDYFNAPSGLTGIETIFPLLLNATTKNKLKLETVIKVLCENPAKIFGIKNKGKIMKGFDADLVLVDLNKKQTIKNSKIHSKCKWTPFNGTTIKGTIEKTIINGNLILNKRKINEKIKGKKISFKKKKTEKQF